MSNSVFPSLPGTDITVDRETIYSTQVRTSVSGKEQRTSWQGTPRYRYRLKFNVLNTARTAPSPWAAYDEAAIVQKFMDDHLGAWDSFLFNDPYSGVQTRVRFESDSLVLRRVVSGIWEASTSLLSVK